MVTVLPAGVRSCFEYSLRLASVVYVFKDFLDELVILKVRIQHD